MYKKFTENTRRYIKELSDFIFPKKISIKKMGSEVKEHFQIISWAIKRIFVIIALVYILFGIVLRIYVLDSLFLGLIIFLYSNFLPDVDSLFKKLNISRESSWYKGYVKITKSRKILPVAEESKWYEKYALLFFAPIFIYYRVFQKARQLYTAKERPFHNIKSLFVYASFLLLIGVLFYGNVLENLSLSLFGGMGYYAHLFVDRSLSLN